MSPRTPSAAELSAQDPVAHPLKRSGYLPSLDGWRALAVLFVMVEHDYRPAWAGSTQRGLINFGGSGVYLFFAISGILICTRLLEEEDLLGRLNLKGFYIRRVLRIQPAAWAYLLVIALLVLVGAIHQWWRFWLGALFLYRNYQLNVTSAQISVLGYFTGHFWTLAVEEHFYLFLSLFLFYVRRARAVWLLVFCAVAVGWPLVFPTYAAHAFLVSQGRRTEMQIIWLLVPALLAVLLRYPRVRHAVERYLTPAVAILVPPILQLLVSALHRGLGTFAAPHGVDNRIYGAILLSFPLWVLATITHPRSLTTRVLEWAPLRWIGRISYSLYLWHVLFFRGVWPSQYPVPTAGLPRLTHAPWNYVAAFAVATLSFYLIERPLMRLGHRLAPPVTAGRKDMRSAPSVLAGATEAPAAVAIDR